MHDARSPRSYSIWNFGANATKMPRSLIYMQDIPYYNASCSPWPMSHFYTTRKMFVHVVIGLKTSMNSNIDVEQPCRFVSIVCRNTSSPSTIYQCLIEQWTYKWQMMYLILNVHFIQWFNKQTGERMHSILKYCIMFYIRWVNFVRCSIISIHVVA